MKERSGYSADISRLTFHFALLYLLFTRRARLRKDGERERSRETKGEEGVKRTRGKRKAWIVTERAAAGLVIINSEKKSSCKGPIIGRCVYVCVTVYESARACMREGERGF